MVFINFSCSLLSATFLRSYFTGFVVPIITVDLPASSLEKSMRLTQAGISSDLTSTFWVLAGTSLFAMIIEGFLSTAGTGFFSGTLLGVSVMPRPAEGSVLTVSTLAVSTGGFHPQAV